MKNKETLTLADFVNRIQANADKITDVKDLEALGFDVDVAHHRPYDQKTGNTLARGGRTVVTITNVSGFVLAVAECTPNDHFVRIIGRQTAIARLVDRVTGGNTAKDVFNKHKHLIPQGKKNKEQPRVDVSAGGVERHGCCGGCCH